MKPSLSFLEAPAGVHVYGVLHAGESRPVEGSETEHEVKTACGIQVVVTGKPLFTVFGFRCGACFPRQEEVA